MLCVRAKKGMGNPAVLLAGLIIVLLFLLSVAKEVRSAEHSMGEIVKQGIAKEFASVMYRSFVPSFSFVQEKRSESVWLLDRQVTEIIPIYGYAKEQKKEALQENEFLALDEILLEEAKEEISVEPENEKLAEVVLELPEEADSVETVVESPQQEAMGGDEQGISLEELLKAENAAAIQGTESVQSAVFVPHARQDAVNLEELQSYETLVQNFYTIDANTMAGSDQLNVSKLTEPDLSISKEGEGPQILIYHTHSQEGFADSVPGDAATTIVGVGEKLATLLTDTYGYRVLHHTGQYDVDVRDDAYSKSLPAIEQVLAENPSIQVIIDLHRDQMPEETKLVMELDGRPTARFMFFNGLSRTRKTGNISYLYNENQEANLAFSFQMQRKAVEYYPGLTRKIYLKGYRYNMHLRPRTLLVELGAQNNTVEEAMNACDPLAHILDMVLSGQEE